MKSQYLDDLDVNELLRVVPSLLRNGDTMLKTAMHIFDRLQSGFLSRDEFRGVLRILQSNVAPNTILSQTYVNLIFNCPYPDIVIENLSQFIEPREDILKSILVGYQTLASQDRDLLLPILGSLADLPLSERLKKDAFLIIIESLSIVSESDLPIVVRSLLTSITRELAQDGIRALRNESKRLKFEDLASILDVIANVLKVNEVAVSEFLKALGNESDFCALDIFVLIILMTNNHSKITKEATEILIHGIDRHAVNLFLLRFVFQMSSEASWIQGDAMVLLAISEQFLISCNPLLCTWAQELFIHLFANFPELRSAILTTLFSIASSSTYTLESMRQDTSRHVDYSSAKGSKNLIFASNFSSMISLATLLHLAFYQLSNVSPFSSLLETFLDQNSQSLNNFNAQAFYTDHISSLIIRQTICQSLAILSSGNHSIINYAMVYIQKNSLRGNVYSQQCSFQLASNIIPILEKSDRSFLISLFMRNAALIPREAISMFLDFLLVSAPYLDLKDLQLVYANFVEPLLKKMKFVKPFPNNSLSSKEGIKEWNYVWSLFDLVRWHLSCLEHSVSYSAVLIKLIIAVYATYSGFIDRNTIPAIFVAPILHSEDTSNYLTALETQDETQALNQLKNPSFCLLEFYYGKILSRALADSILDFTIVTDPNSVLSHSFSIYELAPDFRKINFEYVNILKNMERLSYQYDQRFRHLISLKSIDSNLKIEIVFPPIISFLILLQTDLRLEEKYFLFNIIKTLFEITTLYLVVKRQTRIGSLYRFDADSDLGIDPESVHIGKRDAIFSTALFINQEEYLVNGGMSEGGIGRNIYFNFIVSTRILKNLMELNFHLSQKMYENTDVNISQNSAEDRERKKEEFSLISCCYVLLNLFFVHIKQYASLSFKLLKTLMEAFQGYREPENIPGFLSHMNKLYCGDNLESLGDNNFSSEISSMREAFIHSWKLHDHLNVIFSLLLAIQKFSLIPDDPEFSEILYLTLLRELKFWNSSVDFLMPPNLFFSFSIGDSPLYPIYSNQDAIYRYILIQLIMSKSGDRYTSSIFNAMIEKSEDLILRKSEIPHKIFPSLIPANLPVFVVSFLHCFLEKFKNYSPGLVSEETENPFIPVSELLEGLKSLFQLYIICIGHSMKSLICRIDRFLQIIYEFIPSIRPKLIFCINWRTGHQYCITGKKHSNFSRPKSYHVDSLIPAFTAALKLTRNLGIFISMLKSLHPQLKLFIRLTEGDYKFLPKITRVLEKANESIETLSRRHHIELDPESYLASSETDWIDLLYGNLKVEFPFNFASQDNGSNFIPTLHYHQENLPKRIFNYNIRNSDITISDNRNDCQKENFDSNCNDKKGYDFNHNKDDLTSDRAVQKDLNSENNDSYNGTESSGNRSTIDDFYAFNHPIPTSYKKLNRQINKKLDEDGDRDNYLDLKDFIVFDNDDGDDYMLKDQDTSDEAFDISKVSDSDLEEVEEDKSMKESASEENDKSIKGNESEENDKSIKGNESESEIEGETSGELDYLDLLENKLSNYSKIAKRHRSSKLSS